MTVEISKQAKRVGLIFFMLLPALALASVAWACTTSPTLSPAEASGPAGTLVTIDGSFAPSGYAGSGMRSAAGPVEVRWNHARGRVIGGGNPGELLTQHGTNLSIPVAVPADAAPGVYYLVAIQRDQSGDVIGKASETFEVTGPAVAAPGARTSAAASSGSVEDLWAGFGSAGQEASRLQVGTSTGERTFPQAAVGLTLLTMGSLLLFAAAFVFVRKLEQASKNKSS